MTERRANWQPVRIAPSSEAHPVAIKKKLKLWKSWAGKVIRVRPMRFNPRWDRQYRSLVGCTSKKFYAVHPDDCKVFGGKQKVWLCEHQIQAD